MQATMHHPWRISIHARAKNFEFKFSTSNIISYWGINKTHFFFLLNLRRLFFKMKSETRNTGEKYRKGKSKSNFFQFYEKLFIRRIKSKVAANQKRSKSNPLFTLIDSFEKRHGMFLCEDPITAITGHLTLLSHSVSKKDRGGITIHAFTLFLYLIFLFKKTFNKRAHFPLILAASMASIIGFSLYLNYLGHISEAVWNAWNHAISFGCLYVFTQVAISKISAHIERNKLGGLFILVLLPFYVNKLDLGTTRTKDAKRMLQMAPTWAANLLLMSEIFSLPFDNPRNLKTLPIFICSGPLLAKEMLKFLAQHLAT